MRIVLIHYQMVCLAQGGIDEFAPKQVSPLIPIRDLRYGSDLNRWRRHSLAALCLPVSTPAAQRVLADGRPLTV